MRKLFIASALFLAACTGGESTGIEPVTCSPDSTLTYENFGRALIEQRCLGCHDSENPRLTTVAAIRTHTDSILDEAVYTTSMPEGASMPLSEREMLNEWLACGAP